MCWDNNISVIMSFLVFTAVELMFEMMQESTSAEVERETENALKAKCLSLQHSECLCALMCNCIEIISK